MADQKKLNLMLHAGADTATRDEVYAVQTPQPEGSHYPVGHNQLLEEVTGQLNRSGYSVVNEGFGLTKNGDRFFGVLQLEHNSHDDGNDFGLIVGIRNSHDKKFSASIVAGSVVFVCDNLAFSGEVKIARKHTRYIARDLPNVVHRSVSTLAARYRDQQRSLAAYKETEISDDRARSLILEGLKRKILTASSIPAVLNEWEKPSHDEFAERTNVWRLFNAVTEVAKGYSADATLKRTTLLHGLLDAECGLVVAA